MRQFKTADTKNLKKSGTEEEYTEREVLLQEACDLLRESETLPDSSQIGREIREKSLKKVMNSPETSFSTSKRRKDFDILDIISKNKIVKMKLL